MTPALRPMRLSGVSDAREADLPAKQLESRWSINPSACFERVHRTPLRHMEITLVRDVMECLASRFPWANALVALPMGDSRKP